MANEEADGGTYGRAAGLYVSVTIAVDCEEAVTTGVVGCTAGLDDGRFIGVGGSAACSLVGGAPHDLEHDSAAFSEGVLVFDVVCSYDCTLSHKMTVFSTFVRTMLRFFFATLLTARKQ